MDSSSFEFCGSNDSRIDSLIIQGVMGKSVRGAHPATAREVVEARIMRCFILSRLSAVCSFFNHI